MATSKFNFLIWSYFLKNFVITWKFIPLVFQWYQHDWSVTCGLLVIAIQSYCILKLFEIFSKSKILNALVVGSILTPKTPLWAFLTPRAPRWAPILRPTNPAGLDILAQCPRPRETRCKTSCAKCFIKTNVYLVLLLDRVLEADPIRDHFLKANSQCHQP